MHRTVARCTCLERIVYAYSVAVVVLNMMYAFDKSALFVVSMSTAPVAPTEMADRVRARNLLLSPVVVAVSHTSYEMLNAATRRQRLVDSVGPALVGELCIWVRAVIGLCLGADEDGILACWIA